LLKSPGKGFNPERALALKAGTLYCAANRKRSNSHFSEENRNPARDLSWTGLSASLAELCRVRDTAGGAGRFGVAGVAVDDAIGADHRRIVEGAVYRQKQRTIAGPGRDGGEQSTCRQEDGEGEGEKLLSRLTCFLYLKE